MTSPLGVDLAAALDPVVLAGRAGIVLDDWQVQAVRSDSSRQCLLASRQAGKSTTASVMAVHGAVFRPDSLILLAAPSMRQSSELFRSVSALYRSIGRPVEAVRENTLSLQLENRSRIVCLPASEATSRGYSSVDLLCVDEASRCDESFWQSLRPVVAVSGGKIVLMSTPAGRRGFFFRIATGEEFGWEITRVIADSVPRISKAFLDAERASLPRWVFDQEYACEFAGSESGYFTAEDIEALASDLVAPLFPGSVS